MLKNSFRQLTKMLLLLAVIMLFSFSAYAEEVQELEYSQNEDGTYSVVGIGTYEGTDLIIPGEYNGSPVTRIEKKAFYDNEEITSLVVPNSVTSIGEFAFHYCINLESVTLGNGLQVIENSAFYFCTQLEDLDLGNGLQVIDRYAFYNCTDLDVLTIPNSVTTIKESAFNCCDNLVSIVIGQGVTSLHETVFTDCYKIIEVYNLSSINVVNEALEEGEYYLVDSAMAIHTSLDESSILIWAENGYVFALFDQKYYLVTQTGNETSLTLPNSINDSTYEINRFAFHNRTKLEKIKLGSGITAIGNAAFNFCGINSIVLNEGITSIGTMAFNDCHNLKSITLPSTLTTLGVASFQKCYRLLNIIIPEGIEEIPTNTFMECDSLKSITLPSTLKTIGSAAFYECDSLVSVTLPSGVTQIGSLAFGYCDELKMVYVTEGVTTVGDHAFYGCPKLKIYCEAEKAQSGWSQYWNYYGSPVVWKASLSLKNAFVFLGYSTNGAQICAGYSVNYDIINAVELANGITADFGIVFASYELLNGKSPLDEAGNPIKLETGLVIKTSLSDKGYLFYDFILTDLTEELYDHSFVIAGYTYDGENVVYVQDTEADGIFGKSYNEIMEELKDETANEEIYCPAL
ncbi:MAG: leucine-rich repeat domain-containing protein [Ruminococcaceae bacterium]|nr:leucine-rich repeat domain-containing protein [Oscillospiraceae bacterium]